MIPEHGKLHEDLSRIRAAALAAADPVQAVRSTFIPVLDHQGGLVAIRIGEETWQIEPARHVRLIAAGKAAAWMAAATIEKLGGLDPTGVVVTRYGAPGKADLPENLLYFEAGHPVPDEAGVQAAHLVYQELDAAGAGDVVFCLLSGGASALLTLPVQGVSLSEMQWLTSALLSSGASIQEMNTVRKHLDRLKGGQMARLAQPARVYALILSDVVGDALEVIASGPTAPDRTTYREAWLVLERYRLMDGLPDSIAAHLGAGLRGEIQDTPKPGDPLFQTVTNRVIASNRTAALVAVQEAERMGYHSLLVTTFLEGEARQVGKVIAGLARGIRRHGDPLTPPACLVLGGETTVTLQERPGLGGRNQELALAAALALDGEPGVALMALATDGSDGSTDCAGAVIDGGSAMAARQQGFDPHAFLEGNNSYPLLDRIGALMRTGATGTNVNDLIVLLVAAPSS